MDLFVGNLPPETTTVDLGRLFAGFRHSGFRIAHKQLRSGEQVCFAVGRMESERAGQKAIRKLNGRALGDRTIVVREYVQRSVQNERRALNWRAHFWNAPERRREERRSAERYLPDDPFAVSSAPPVALFRDGALF